MLQFRSTIQAIFEKRASSNFGTMSDRQNIIGGEVRKLRLGKNISQEELAAKCCVLGWDLSRGTLAKIEARVRCVTDRELFILAKALHSETNDLFPTDFKQQFAKTYRLRRNAIGGAPSASGH
jgi:transcriptional regulator with XRE-family HTH domain